MPKIYLRWGDLFTLFIILIMIAALIIAKDWPLRASIIVLALGGAGLILAIAQLILDITRPPEKEEARPVYEIRSFNSVDPALYSKNSMEMWAWFIGTIAMIPVLSLPVTMVLFVFLYSKIYGASWTLSFSLSGATAFFIWGLYMRLMDVYWPDSLLGNYIPLLSS